MSFLRLERVSKRYGSPEEGVTALDDVSFELDRGRLLAVLGPSGSGKTTLLSVVAGLLSASSGEIILDGRPVRLRSKSEAAAFRRRQMGLVFQDYHLIPYLTARENLLLVPHLSGRVAAEQRARADGLLEDFGLSDRARHKPGQLSGGERQRVAIARALMNRPKLMLVDEPTSHLDTARGRQVMELLRDQVRGSGVTCIVVTHDQRMTESVDETLLLLDGRVAGHNRGS
jgi:putative ABC transport system ATP-binding protein